MDITINPKCNRNMDPDTAFSSNLGPNITMTLVMAQTTQISVALVTARPLNTNMVSGGCPDPGHLQSTRWQPEPQTSTQTLAAIESLPQPGCKAAA